ncbi:MAG: hypothetical protein LV481_02700 [Methylacidiphilales bacterium]|nr:hypothetical protein [Candidatus Methylacidiphilales bacterium]
MPKAPYLAPVPDYGHWIVTFKSVTDASPGTASPADGTAAATSAPPVPPAPDASPKTIETIKTGNLRGVTVTLNNGTSSQFTCKGDWILCSTPTGPALGIASPLSHPYTYYTTGYILLDGVTINMSTFKETALHNGALAFHYKSGDVNVWIDPVSMLPLTVKNLDVEASYRFLTPPSEPLPIPKDQAALLQKEEAAYKAVSSMR